MYDGPEQILKTPLFIVAIKHHGATSFNNWQWWLSKNPSRQSGASPCHGQYLTPLIEIQLSIKQ
jgi:hypothetical protein